MIVININTKTNTINVYRENYLYNGGMGSGIKGHTTQEKESEDITSIQEVKSKQGKVNINFSKDNILPELNKEDLRELGKKSKPILLKKSVIERNKIKHPDIKESEYNTLISKALYEPDLIFSGHDIKYTNFISRISDKNNSTVLLEMSEEKNEFEIVHIHKIKDKALQKMRQRDDK